MKKQLRFLYRYLIVARRWRRWVNTHTVMAAFVSLVFVTTLSWGAPISGEKPRGSAANENLPASVDALPAALQETQTPTGLAAQPTRTATPFPPEFATNSDQTIGVTLAGAVLVLIVVVGVLSFMPKKDQE